MPETFKILAVLLAILLCVFFFQSWKGSRKLRKMQEEIEQDTWQMGYDLGFSGMPYTPGTNPFVPGTELHRVFYDGWKGGREASSMEDFDA